MEPVKGHLSDDELMDIVDKIPAGIKDIKKYLRKRDSKKEEIILDHLLECPTCLADVWESYQLKMEMLQSLQGKPTLSLVYLREKASLLLRSTQDNFRVNATPVLSMRADSGEKEYRKVEIKGAALELPGVRYKAVLEVEADGLQLKMEFFGDVDLWFMMDMDVNGRNIGASSFQKKKSSAYIPGQEYKPDSTLEIYLKNQQDRKLILTIKNK